MAAILPPSVLPDIFPTRREINKRHASRFISVVGEANCEIKPAPQLISLLVGEMSGRTEGGKRHSLRGQTHAH